MWGPINAAFTNAAQSRLERVIITTTARSVHPNFAIWVEIATRLWPETSVYAASDRERPACTPRGKGASRVWLLGEEASGPADGRETCAWTLASITLAR